MRAGRKDILHKGYNTDMKRYLLLVLLLLTLVACQTSSIETRVERVNYTVDEITYQDDESLLIGQEQPLQAAVPGSKEVTKEVTLDRGKIVAEKIISETIIVEAKPAIVARGVKEVRRRIEVETIPHPTDPVYQDDDTMAEGETTLAHEAQDGEVRVTYKDTYVRGKLIKSEELRRREMQPALAQTWLVGTKVAEEQPNPPIVSEPDPVVVPPTPDPVVPTPDPVTPPPTGYGHIPNDDLSWWYQVGPPSTISWDVANLLSGHRVYWQMSNARPVVYLTIDEGYEYNNNTATILDTLSTKGVKATFFLTGSYVNNNPGLVQRMINEGHQLANHTINHYRASTALAQSDDLFIQDVVQLNQMVPSMTKLHRPPEGGYSQRSLQILDDLGYTTVFWSFAYRDWLTDAQPDPAQATQTILSNLHNGSILLLHAVSNTNTAILGDVIDGIYSRGYSIELLPTP